VTARVSTMLSFETGNLVFCTLEDKKEGNTLLLKKDGE